MTDQELINGLHSGEQKAVSLMYDKFRDVSIKRLAHKGVNEQDAEDIFHDALLSELRSRKAKELQLQTATYATYFRAVLNNHYLNFCRKHNRRANVTPEELTLPGIEPDVERELTAIALRATIDRGFSALGDECRMLLRLKLILGTPLTEIARQLKITHVVARQRSSRCSRRLRKLILRDPIYHELND